MTACCQWESINAEQSYEIDHSIAVFGDYQLLAHCWHWLPFWE